MKISKFDWLVYRLFRWRWNPILKRNKMMRDFIIHYFQAFEECIDDDCTPDVDTMTARFWRK